jgi:Fe-S cluster biogenesis protein NfuA
MESTPNPEVMKFVANKILTEDSIELLNNKNSNQVPLAMELFKFPFIKSIFISYNFISITKNNDIDWHEISTEVREFINNYLNKNGFVNNFKSSENIESQLKDDDIIQHKQIDTKNLSDFEKNIVSIIEQYIQPAVAADGGSIVFKSFEEGVVYVILKGACSGCPSSTITLKQGIENLLKQKLGNDIKEVMAYNG